MPNRHRVHYLCNLHLRTKFFGYQPGDTVVEAGVEDFDAADDPHALESAFMFWNRDARPNGRTAPSMSVGDVAMVRGPLVNGVRFYACGHDGWQRIEPPIEFIPDDPAQTPAVLLGEEAARLNAEAGR